MCVLNLNYPDFDYVYQVEPTKEDYKQYIQKGGKPITFTPKELEQSYEFYDFMVHKYEKEAYIAYAREQDMLVTSLSVTDFIDNN